MPSAPGMAHSRGKAGSHAGQAKGCDVGPHFVPVPKAKPSGTGAAGVWRGGKGRERAQGAYTTPCTPLNPALSSSSIGMQICTFLMLSWNPSVVFQLGKGPDRAVHFPLSHLRTRGKISLKEGNKEISGGWVWRLEPGAAPDKQPPGFQFVHGRRTGRKPPPHHTPCSNTHPSPAEHVCLSIPTPNPFLCAAEGTDKPCGETRAAKTPLGPCSEVTPHPHHPQ